MDRPDRRLWVALGALTFLGGRCGPTSEEAGGAVLIASPLVILFSMSLLAILRAMWERRYPDARQDWRPVLRAAGVLALLAALGLAVSGSQVAEWVTFALWLFGASHLALTLVLFRIWLHWSPSRAFTWAPIPPMVLLALPALVLLGRGEEKPGDIIGLWVVPGYMGVVPAVVYLALIVEAVIRGRRPAP